MNTNGHESSALGLLADIRAAVGDPNGRLMQDELVEHCRELYRKAEALKRENQHLRDALLLAAQWGIASDSFSVDTSNKLRDWVIRGMHGEPPKGKP